MVNWLKNITLRFKANIDGATAIEYGMIAAAVALVIILAVFSIGGNLNEFLTGVNDKIADQNASVN